MFRLVWVVVFLLVLLGIRFWFYYRDLPVYKDGQKVSLFVTLKGEPEIRSGKLVFTVWDHRGVRISIVSSSVLPYHYGDRLFIEGFFTVRDSRYFLYFPNIQIVNSDQNYLSQFDAYIKNNSRSLLNSSISPVSSSLLMGLIFGGRQGMPREFMEKLRIVGVFHVIAASGMNVSFVAAVLMSIFGRIMKRQAVLLFSVTGVVFYAYLAGFEASIVRASIMAIIAFSAALMGRQYIALFALAITAYVMLFYFPGNFQDIGFQLSFLSTLGILEIKPLFPWQKYFIVEDIGITLAAQLATFPVILSVFGQYGILSVLVNVFVLWTIPFLMIFGVMAIVSGLIFIPLGKLLVWFCLPFLLYFERTVSFFAGLNWIWKLESFPIEFFAAYYFILAAMVVAAKKHKVREAKKT